SLAFLGVPVEQVSLLWLARLLLIAVPLLVFTAADTRGERHIWNPTNFGVTMLLFLAPDYVASLTVRAGNSWLAIAIIWTLGSIILWRLRLVHIPAAFVLSFIPLSFFRSWVTGDPWLTEL